MFIVIFMQKPFMNEQTNAQTNFLLPDDQWAFFSPSVYILPDEAASHVSCMHH